MTHFTVLVPAANKEELEEKLLPFHEYECTGIEKYLEFVPTDIDELQADFAEHGNGRSLDEFAEDWDGCTKNSEGVYGHVTNPNAKWDWWIIGGRWTGLLNLKPGTTGANGEPGLMTKPNYDPTKADVALVRDVVVPSDKSSALTFAFIDLEGKWNERGSMGWFGMVSDENDDYDEIFWRWWETLPGDQRVYVVDCHI